MKKLTALLLLVVMLLTSCGIAGTNTTENPDTTLPNDVSSSTDKPVVLCDHEQIQNVSQPAKILTDGFARKVCRNCGEVVEETIIPATKSLKILAVGNSYSSDCTVHLYGILKDLGLENVIVANAFIGGCNITQHYNNSKSNEGLYKYTKYTSNGTEVTENSRFMDMIKDESWDIVTVQQASHYSGREANYSNLSNLVSVIIDNVPNSPNLDIKFNMTWAYQSTYDAKKQFAEYYNSDQMTMYNAIVSVMKSKVQAEERISQILPVGTTIQNLRTSYIGDNLNRDGSHLTLDVGRYTAALTWACAITGASPYDVDWVPEEYVYIEDDFDAIREAVTNAIANPLEVTKSTYLTQKAELTDAMYFANAGLNIDNYELLNWNPTPNVYWDSSNGYTPVLPSSADKTPNYYIASKKLKKDDIPVNSVIIVDKGYKYRPDGWQILNQKNSSQLPRETVTRFTLVTEDWWQDFNYRAFNLSSIKSKTVMELSDAEHLRIYVPKK